MTELRRPGAERRALRRHLTPWQRMSWIVKAGRIAFYSVIALFLVVLGALSANEIATRDDPIYRGTFTFTHCVESGRDRHCSEHGDWTSDDGLIHLTDVTLDGSNEPSGQTEAYYKPTSFAPETVHTPDLMPIVPWGPWIGIAATIGWAVVQTWRWRRYDRGYGGGV